MACHNRPADPRMIPLSHESPGEQPLLFRTNRTDAAVPLSAAESCCCQLDLPRGYPINTITGRCHPLKAILGLRPFLQDSSPPGLQCFQDLEAPALGIM